MQNTSVQVLVVEDSNELIMLWKALFARTDFKAQFANSGKDAFAVVESGFLPNVLMTDFYLPDMTGADLIMDMRKKNPNLKCLVVTGNSNTDFQTMLPVNTEVLVKPVRFDKLKETVKSLVGVAPVASAEC